MNKPPLAPWHRFPELPAGHIGWRMGLGEQYLVDLSQWLLALPESDRKHWLYSLRPIPYEWMDWAINWYITPYLDDEDQLDAAWEALYEGGSDANP